MKHPFDEFSKSLSERSVPRRESLRRLGAVFLGAILGPLALGLETTSGNPDDRPRRGRRRGLMPRLSEGKRKNDPCVAFCRCRNNQQQNQCLSACRACSNDPARLKGSCGNYVCCGSGQSYCGGRCVDLKSDPNNCGSCGRACGSGSQCVNGTCSEIPCPTGQTKCGSSCVDLSSDNANCGACGNVCSPGIICANGTCSGSDPNCPPGTDFLFDALNCGACGHQCQPLEHCSFGVCEGVCIDC